MLLFSLSHYLSLSFCLPVCLQSILSISISLTARSMNKIKLTFAKLVRACALFIFNAMTIRSPGGATYGYRRSSSSSCNWNSRSHLPFYLLSVCSSKTIFHYILSSLTQTHTDRHTDTLEKSHKFFRGQSPPNTRVSSFLFGLASIA